MQKNPVYLALQQRQQFLGCDRELCLTLLLICFALGFCAASLQAALLCLIIFGAGFFLLRQMGKSDLMLRQVFIRQLFYKTHYDAQAGFFARGGKRYV